MLRGTEFPQMVAEIDGTDVFKWEKIEFGEVEKHKARITEFLAAYKADKTTIDGKECLEVKVLK